MTKLKESSCEFQEPKQQDLRSRLESSVVYSRWIIWTVLEVTTPTRVASGPSSMCACTSATVIEKFEV